MGFCRVSFSSRHTGPGEAASAREQRLPSGVQLVGLEMCAVEFPPVAPLRAQGPGNRFTFRSWVSRVLKALSLFCFTDENPRRILISLPHVQQLLTEVQANHAVHPGFRNSDGKDFGLEFRMGNTL